MEPKHPTEQQGEQQLTCLVPISALDLHASWGLTPAYCHVASTVESGLNG